jgi:hypothetical protein
MKQRRSFTWRMQKRGWKTAAVEWARSRARTVGCRIRSNLGTWQQERTFHMVVGSNIVPVYSTRDDVL